MEKEKKIEINKEKSNRMNVLYILLVLKNYSSASNPLSISKIQDYVNKDYYQGTHDTAAKINITTISRILAAFHDDYNFSFTNVSTDYYSDKCNLGFNLYCVMKGEDGTWKTYDNPSDGKGPTKYYYYESVFSDKELRILIDSVETYNYFSTDDIAGLVSKLLSLRPKSDVLNKHHNSTSCLKDESSMVLCNVDEFNRIIKQKNFANITYCNYNHKHELITRTGYPRLIRPLSMMWSNGYYYLVALLGPGYTPANLRMDRITKIEVVEPTEDMKKSFQVDVNLDISTYRMNHPVMHGGKVTHITMLYLDTEKNGMTNAIIDTFGLTTQISSASKDEITKNIPFSAILFANNNNGTWMRVDFYATTAGTKLFATQYCNYCKIIHPPELKNEIMDNLQRGLQLYNDN